MSNSTSLYNTKDISIVQAISVLNTEKTQEKIPETICKNTYELENPSFVKHFEYKQFCTDSQTPFINIVDRNQKSGYYLSEISNIKRSLEAVHLSIQEKFKEKKKMNEKLANLEISLIKQKKQLKSILNQGLLNFLLTIMKNLRIIFMKCLKVIIKVKTIGIV